MSATLAAPNVVGQEQAFALHGLRWGQYVTIADALPERRDLRITFVDGRLTFLTTSRRHDWFAECLGELVVEVARCLGIRCEPAGSATFRLEELGVGVEGDKTFYFGANADRMRGPQDIDLSTQPPPDLAIEVEVTHPAGDAMLVYGRLRVPEVWRFDVGRETVGFWLRREDGSYATSPRSAVFPVLEPKDVLDQLRLAQELGWSDWSDRLGDWVRNTLVPRNVDPA
jgi:Uma2 family endonuclease